MNGYHYNDLRIEVFNDPSYAFDSPDAAAKYARHYLQHESEYLPNAIHGIRIYNDEQEINSCVITNSGGATTICEDSSLLDGDRLLVCCANRLFSLSLPSLNLVWSVEADWATCFSVHRLREDYVIHGELQVACISKEGVVIWTFGGADIFVSMDGEPSFQFAVDQILLRDSDGRPHMREREYMLLKDFNGREYRLGFDGEEISGEFQSSND